MSKPSRYILVALIFYSYAAFGQTKLNNQLFKDSVSLTLDSAENIFLRNNLLLLAQRYNVDAQKALIIQAKLLPNPNFSYARGPLIPIHDDQSNYPYSNFFNNAENAASISQLILLAGKRINKLRLRKPMLNWQNFSYLI